MADNNLPFFAEHKAMLEQITQNDRYRRLIPQKGLDFSSNDYLGLSGSPRLRRAIGEAIDRGVPSGSGGSRLLRGNHPEHELLEEEAARFFGTESALFFPNGFVANLALFGTLPQKGDLLVYDELIHASVHEAMRLGRAETARARHNDVQSFRDCITDWRKSGATGRIWIAAESLYSMDGDIAPIAELAQLADEFNGYLVIDEAHATGVFGPAGRGLAAEFDGRENIISLHTCGKALGCEGALLTGAAAMKEFIINRGRGFIFSTAPSPLMASAVRESLHILADEPERRVKLAELSRFARNQLSAAVDGEICTQIIPVIIGDDQKAMDAAAYLQENGFDVRGIRPPTVPAGTSRLRVSITLNVEQHHIEQLVAHITEIRL